MSVVEIKRVTPSANEVVKTLRHIADQIEANEWGYPVTTAVLCIGHTELVSVTEETITGRDYWDTFAFGPRADTFTARGLLSQCLNEWTSR